MGTADRWSPGGGVQAASQVCPVEDNVCEQNNENEDMPPRDMVRRSCIVGMRESTGGGAWQSPE